MISSAIFHFSAITDSISTKESCALHIPVPSWRITLTLNVVQLYQAGYLLSFIAYGIDTNAQRGMEWKLRRREGV
ncbi:MAG TPA: hypothetical protein PKV73_11360 [Agriterribacter sp.]|nr:hypothetical protein [Chitinophagaceae bacterium]HRP32485.1 hypothetical protein [Agriterribacter sp.]